MEMDPHEIGDGTEAAVATVSGEMIPLQKIPRDRGVIDEQITVRRKLKAQMVGWLYPRILQREIETLEKAARRSD